MKITKFKSNPRGAEIYVEFINKGKKGSFIYSFFGDEAGIGDCTYAEAFNEDIYDEIHSWVRKHIRVTVNLRMKRCKIWR